MKKWIWLALLAASAPAWAGLPHVRQSIPVTGSNSTSISCTLPFATLTATNGVTNRILVLHSRSTGSSTGVSDNESNAYSHLINAGTSGGVDAWIAPVTTPGTTTISITAGNSPTFQSVYCFELQYTTQTLDGSATTGTWSSGSPITTSNITSTVGFDLMVCDVGPTNGSALAASAPAGSQHETGRNAFISNGANDFTFVKLTSANPSSTNTATWTDDGSGGSGGTYACFLLKPSSTIEISDDGLPSAATGSPYSYTLTCAGNVGSCTYTILSGSLPSGLNFSSGGTFSGTPTAGAASTTFSIRVSDGTNTATKNLTLKLGATFKTITVRQCTSTTAGGNSLTLTGTTAGNLIGAFTMQSDGASGAASANDNVGVFFPTDSAGDVYTYINDSVYWYNLSAFSNMHLWLHMAQIGTGGSLTVSLPFSTSTNHGFAICEIAGAQPFFDGTTNATTGTTNGTGITITSTSLTTPVANEFMIAIAASFISGTNSVSPNSPFTASGNFCAHNCTNAEANGGYNVMATAGGHTVSYTVSNDSGKSWQILTAALRPDVTGTPSSGKLLKWIGD
jgi:large repetitive protein